MPERAAAVLAIANHLEGGVSFNSIDETAKLGSIEGIRRTIHLDEYYDRYDGAFVAAMDKIDWNRILLEASRRHLVLKEKRSSHSSKWHDYGDEICPECLGEAVLASGWQDWEKEPTSRRSRTSDAML